MLLPAEEPHLRERGLDQMLLQPRGAALPTPDTGLPSQQTGTVAVCGSGCPVRGALSWLPFPRQVCRPSCPAAELFSCQLKLGPCEHQLPSASPQPPAALLCLLSL